MLQSIGQVSIRSLVHDNNRLTVVGPTRACVRQGGHTHRGITASQHRSRNLGNLRRVQARVNTHITSNRLNSRLERAHILQCTLRLHRAVQTAQERTLVTNTLVVAVSERVASTNERKSRTTIHMLHTLLERPRIDIEVERYLDIHAT